MTASVTETDPDRDARRTQTVRVRELPPIGPDAYEMLGEIARGGMGRIVRARDRRLGRTVAIKQLLDPSPNMIALFEREVRITARLQHPSIVSVLEAGVLPSGDPIYVMKLVPGRALRDVLRDSLAVSERLGLLPITIAIADALAYAHDQGVIHRDLKPSNVLVGEFGEVVVIDWGLAHDGAAVDERPVLDETDATVTARAMGTPAYMAPEAARGEPVDERADVYAIGAILYETLSGAPPYRGDDSPTILAAVREGPPEPIAKRAPGTPADLAAIIDKAMAHDREARYPTARELADELRRFARGQLVSAHVYSIRDRAWRWIRRNRGAVSVAAAAGALVISLVAIGVSRIVHERDVAAQRAERLTLARARLEIDRDPVLALATLTALPPDSPLWSAARTIASNAVERGVPRHAGLGAPIDAVAIVDGRPRVVHRRDDAIEIVSVGAGGQPVNIVARLPHRAEVVALSSDGGVLATVGEGRVRVWRVGAPEPILDRPGPRVAPAIAVSADGTAVAAAGRDFGLIAWRIQDGSELARDDQARFVDRIAMTGTTVGFANAGKIVTLRAGASSSIEQTNSSGQTIVGLVVARDVAIAARSNGEVRFLDPESPRATAVGVSATALAVSPDDELVVAAGERGIAVMDRTGRTLRSIPTRRRARAAAIDVRGVIAITDGADVWWWENSEPERVRVVGPSAPAVAIATMYGGGVVATEDGSVWAWRDGATVRLGAHAAATRAIVIAPDGRFAVTTGDDRTVRRWNLAAATSEIIGVHQGPGLALAIAPDGLLASGGADRVVRLWNGATGSVLGQHAGRIHALAFARDGSHLASIGDDVIARVWPITQPTAGRRPPIVPRELVHDAPVTAIAWLDDDTLVTGTRDGTVRLWSGDDEPRVLCRHDGTVRSIAIANQRIASGGDDGRVGLGDSAGMELHGGHDDLVRRVTFAPDGATLASASEDGTLRLWDPITAESRPVTLGQWVVDAVFTLDGSAVIAAGADDVWMIRDRLPHDRNELRRAIEARIEAAR